MLEWIIYPPLGVIVGIIAGLLGIGGGVVIVPILVYPLPLTEKFDYLGLLRRARLSLCYEHNATGQFARLLRAETGFEFSAHIHRYDGRPLAVEGLVREIDGYAGRL